MRISNISDNRVACVSMLFTWVAVNTSLAIIVSALQVAIVHG